MKTFIKTFLNDESGASAAEYALILAVVGVAIGAGALALGQNVGQAIENASDNVKACGEDAATPGSGFIAVPSNCTGTAAPAPAPA